MNARVLVIGIALLILIGLAYYIGTNRDADVTENQQNETVSLTDPKSAETSQMLVGVWRSKDDSKFTREFTAQSTIIDRYGGEDGATSSGTFTVFTYRMEIPEGVNFTLDTGVAYIRAIMDGEGYTFRVSSISASELELMYMDRGGVLRFSRIQ